MQALPDSKMLAVPGGNLAYIDEGYGPAVVMVHGTPTWSFLYRRLIADLSRDHRVVAVDHLGFGRSDKPVGWSGKPEDHAENLRSLLDHLALERYTLVVHDFGGPIGLGAALRRPEQLSGLVLFNTWLWSTEGTAGEKIGRLSSGALLRWLYLRLAFSPRFLLPALFANRSALTPEVKAAYLEPFAHRDSREGTWRLARALAESNPWYASLWERRGDLAAVPSLILWGSRDKTFGAEHLARWRKALPDARVVELTEAGHFPMEEAPDEIAREVRDFLSGQGA